ncbi:hypothetical protein C8R44DRAFT_949777 [Mycena epipterygia]|nr:hypothetical protein C8R44DRAFT_949777 [Mycena epipterygia]
MARLHAAEFSSRITSAATPQADFAPFTTEQDFRQPHHHFRFDSERRRKVLPPRHPLHNCVNIHYATPRDAGNTTAFYAQASVDTDSIIEKNGTPLEQVEFDVLAPKVSAQFGSYVGADAAINLSSGRASIFDATFGIGVSTGAGICDDSIDLRAIGCGFTIGKHVGIAFLAAALRSMLVASLECEQFPTSFLPHWC